MQEEETGLIQRAKDGDRLALSLLLQRHYTFLVRYLIKVTMQPSLAEDLAQETMLRCVEKIGLYNGKSKFSSWLVTIASRLYIDHTRKQQRDVRLLEREKTAKKLRWQTELAMGNWSDVLEALVSLNGEIRVPVILKHYYGYSYDEIAEMMDIPVGTVKSRVHNGLKIVRKELTNNEGEPR